MACENNPLLLRSDLHQLLLLAQYFHSLSSAKGLGDVFLPVWVAPANLRAAGKGTGEKISPYQCSEKGWKCAWYESVTNLPFTFETLARQCP